MDKNKENLRELIEKFMDPQNAQMYLEDIEAGEQILRDNPAPKPDDMLLANIKANIALNKIHQRTVTFRKRVYEAIAIAASLIIIATISFRSLNETPPPTDTSYYSSLIPKKPEWSWKQKATEISDMIKDDINDIDDKFAQVAMDTTSFGYDSFNEYDNEIRQLENRLYNISNKQDGYPYMIINDNSLFEDIEDLENRFNELGESFLQEDYSNYDTLDI